MKKRFLRYIKLSCMIINIVLLIIFICCIFCRFSYSPFNSKDVINDIKFYSANEFKGRLCGSKENNEAKNNIINYFKENNLSPLNDDYNDDFKTIVPIKDSYDPSLIIKDNSNKIIHSFVLGKDFKEDAINFKSTNIEITKADNPKVLSNSILISKNNKDYLFYLTDDSNFSFRSSFIYSSQFEFAFEVNKTTFNSIINYLNDGYTLSCSMPYITEEKSVSNVCCVIKGTEGGLPPLILCAHYDHVGCDSLNNVYYGALDNASGVCLLMNLAKNISSLPAPKRDIIFVALNGEEFGLLGSKHFNDTYKDTMKNAKVINFDMVGAKNYDISLVKSEDSKNNSSALLEDLEKICKDKNIEYEIRYEDCSDHASFSSDSFDAVTLCQSDISNIHTPRDSYEKISQNDIDKVYSIVYPEVISSCYDIQKLIFYKNSTLVICTICLVSSLLITSYFFVSSKKCISDSKKGLP